MSYCRRTLTKMQFDIHERGDDDDGQGGSKPISEEQARDLKILLDDAKANIPSFLELIAGVPTIAEIPERDWKRVLHAAEVKSGRKR